MVIGGIELFEDVLPEDYLELSNSIVIKNLKELYSSLRNMKKSDFELHVTKSRNDFAEWTLETYNDEKLTKKLLNTTDKNRILKILSVAIKDAENRKPTTINIPKNKKSILESLEKVNYEM